MTDEIIRMPPLPAAPARRPAPSADVMRRLWRAATAVRDYTDRADIDASDAEVLTDLLTDLMHYCDQLGPSFDEALRIALVHFEQERSE